MNGSLEFRPNLRLPDLDALSDEEPHDLGAAPPGRVVQRVVAPLGAGVEVGPRPQQQIQDVDPAVVRFINGRDTNFSMEKDRLLQSDKITYAVSFLRF